MAILYKSRNNNPFYISQFGFQICRTTAVVHIIHCFSSFPLKRTNNEVKTMSETDKNRLLRIRKLMKRKMPKWRRENYYRLKRIQGSWRRPKGIDSKMRHKLGGKRKSPNIGYRKPKAVRGLHPSGKEVVRVENLNELEAVNTETQVAQLGTAVGSRKRLNLVNYAEENDIYIINPQIKRTDFGLDDEFELDDDIAKDDFDDLSLVDDEELTVEDADE